MIRAIKRNCIDWPRMTAIELCIKRFLAPSLPSCHSVDHQLPITFLFWMEQAACASRCFRYETRRASPKSDTLDDLSEGQPLDAWQSLVVSRLPALRRDHQERKLSEPRAYVDGSSSYRCDGAYAIRTRVYARCRHVSCKLTCIGCGGRTSQNLACSIIC